MNRGSNFKAIPVEAVYELQRMEKMSTVARQALSLAALRANAWSPRSRSP
jgi:hypothetical protein